MKEVHPFKQLRQPFFVTGSPPAFTPDITYEHTSHVQDNISGSGVDRVIEQGAATYVRIRVDTHPVSQAAVRAETARRCALWCAENNLNRAPSEQRQIIRDQVYQESIPVHPTPAYQECMILRQPRGKALWCWTKVPAIAEHAATTVRHSLGEVPHEGYLVHPRARSLEFYQALREGRALPHADPADPLIPAAVQLEAIHVHHDNGAIMLTGDLSPLDDVQTVTSDVSGTINFLDDKGLPLMAVSCDFGKSVIRSVTWPPEILHVENESGEYDYSLIADRLARLYRDLGRFFDLVAQAV